MGVTTGPNAVPTAALSAAGRVIQVDPGDPRDPDPRSAALWCRALTLRSWDVVIDAGADVDEMQVGALIPDEGRSWCARAVGDAGGVIRAAETPMATTTHWALLVEVLHLTGAEISELAHLHALFLLDRRTEALLRMPGGHARLAQDMLGSGWLHPRECLILSPAVRELVEA